MNDHSSQGSAWAPQVAVDASVRAAFGGASYADAFGVAAVPGVAPAEWARLTLAGGPSWTQRAFGELVWHRALGFDLEPRGAPGTFVGWRITTDTPSSFVIDTDGPKMRGRIVFATTGSSMIWTTMIRYHRPSAERVWSVLSPVHRAITARLLAQAHNHLLRRTTRALSADRIAT